MKWLRNFFERKKFLYFTFIGLDSVNLNRLLSSFMSQDKELDVILITSLKKYYDNLQYNTLVLITSTLALELDQFQPHFIVIIFI